MYILHCPPSFPVESLGHDRDWISSKPPSCDCGGHAGCSTPVCINDNGLAKSFDTVCEAMQYMAGKTRQIVIAVGLGRCKDLYGCE